MPVTLSLHQASCPLVWGLFQLISPENKPSDFQIAPPSDCPCHLQCLQLPSLLRLYPRHMRSLCIHIPFCRHIGHCFLPSAHSVITPLLPSKNIICLLISPISILFCVSPRFLYCHVRGIFVELGKESGRSAD